MACKERHFGHLKRRKPQRAPYERVLIVCEGGKTEPQYFTAIKDDLKLLTANVEIKGTGNDPRQLVNYAQDRYEEDKRLHGRDNGFDRVFCVFDQDTHAHYHEAGDRIKNCRPQDVFYAITSVPCFEFWLLLHFIATTKPYAQSGKRSPGDCVIDDLEQYLPAYAKGDFTIYAQVKHKTNIAIQRAIEANRQAEQSATDNPTTLIYMLVEYLRNLRS